LTLAVFYNEILYIWPTKNVSMSLFDKTQASAVFIQERVKTQPKIGIILGSGLGGLVHLIDKEAELHYEDIPNFALSTVKGHGCSMVFGKIEGVEVVLMAGRFHYYEGYTMDQVTFPVRVMKALGVHTLIVSNASGGTNPGFAIGDLMIIKDHVNLFPEHPLRGANDERLGTRFPDMGQPYDNDLIELAKEVAAEKGLTIRSGVYVGLQGPTFETPAEYRWLHTIGGDAVGMSTVPEVIVARHAELKVFAISVITDIGISHEPISITHEDVLEAAHAATPKMAAIVAGMVKAIGEKVPV
jgi:purine-nucleoside phosphorylase